MHSRKPKPELLKKLEQKKERLLKAITENAILVGGESSSLWKAIKSKVELKRQSIELQLDSYDELKGHDQLIAILESRRELRFFSDLPRTSEAMNRILQNELNQTAKEINEHKTKLGS